MQRIGVFGSSFNPPTLGHFNVLKQADNEFDLIVLVPSLAHAFHKAMIDISHRLKMLSIFVENWEAYSDKHNVQIENIEETLLNKKDPKAPIYTFDVLSALTKKYQEEGVDCAISFIIGPDNYKKEVWQKFYRYQEIEENWEIFVAKREVAVSSSLVRKIISSHKGDLSSLKEKLENLLDPKIMDYILEHHLYRVTT